MKNVSLHKLRERYNMDDLFNPEITDEDLKEIQQRLDEKGMGVSFNSRLLDKFYALKSFLLEDDVEYIQDKNGFYFQSNYVSQKRGEQFAESWRKEVMLFTPNSPRRSSERHEKLTASLV